MLSLHNTLTRRKEAFQPLDAANIRMYVCGPTVYDRPHLGNARSVVVYDVLFRLLRQLYGADHVNYVRNITDVDDKINARARERHIPISALTQEVTAQFHADMAALNVLNPTQEPRATAHIAQMCAIISALITRKHAYVSEGHVLFDVHSYAQYGQLSGRKTEEQKAGARIAVESYKRNAGDFVLWKPAEAGDDASSVFDSPWGPGRPGWHIECSAMSSEYLGPTFDIHGGGADLMFPHHENEIAQSRCADAGAEFAKYWVHNGFLTINGEKMSKSLGNFITVHDLLTQGVRGEVIRYALLSAKYNEPLDWNDKLLHDAKLTLDYFYNALAKNDSQRDENVGHEVDEEISILADDLNTPAFFAKMRTWANSINKTEPGSDEQDIAAIMLRNYGKLVGLFQFSPLQWFTSEASLPETEILAAIDARNAAKKAKNFAEADRIRGELKDKGILLEDKPGGVTEWRSA